MEKRENFGDRWRGFAVFLMLGANLAGSSLLPPHPGFLRFLFSIPAPIFIGLAGYFSFRQSDKKLFFRGSMLFLSAIVIDYLGWRITPFQEWDVLYVLGIGLWLSILLQKSWGLWIGFAIGLFCLISFAFPLTFHQGWFPPMPWLLIYLLGYWKNRFPIVSRWLWLGIFSCIYLLQFPPNPRLGYSEWYYPISGFSLAFAIGVVGMMMTFPRLIPGFLWIEKLGKNSLLVYILSSFIIAWGTSKWIHGWKFSLFAFLWLSLVVFFVTFVFRNSKKSHV